MRFIDYYNTEVFLSVAFQALTFEGSYGRKDYVVAGRGLKAPHLNAYLMLTDGSGADELVVGALEQLTTMRQHERPFAAPDARFYNFRKYYSLSASCRQH
jgi:hypothetical protein